MRAIPFLILFIFSVGIAHASYISVSPAGGHSDQNTINDAIDTVVKSGGGMVYLNAGTYFVDGPVLVKSNLVLAGDQNAIIKVYSGSSQWFINSIGIISNAENLHNVEISGFQVDGSVTELPPEYHHSRPDTAHDCERCILFVGDSNNQMSNISIFNMTLFDSFSDGTYIRFCDNVHIYNNFISNTQHEGTYLVCCRYSLVENNRIAGICSDCMRFDNNQNTEVRFNTCWSYNGSHASNTYMHGEAGIQVGNTGSSKGYSGENKPFFTQNIYVHDNSFINNGLNAVLIDGDVKDDNVYFTNNTIIGHDQLETSGFPISSIDNYSYENPPTIEQSKQTFTSILDFLKKGFVFQYPAVQQDFKASATVTYYNDSIQPYATVEVQGEDIKVIKYEYAGKSVRYFQDNDIWTGELGHAGNAAYLPGHFQPEELQITVYGDAGFQKVENITVSEQRITKAGINPDLFIFIAVLAVLGISIARSLRRIL